MKTALLQYSPVWENKSENKKTIFEIIDNSNTDFDLLVLPEMTLTGFTMNSTAMAEEIEGESYRFFSSLALKYKCSVIAGMILRENDKCYNALICFNRLGEKVATYKKIHLFSYADENLYYSAGDETVIIEIEKVKFGLSICFDLRFPELFRIYGKAKVDAIINIANWPKQRIEHYRALLKSRAIENLSYMIGVNRVGSDPKAEYNGYTSCFEPLGSEVIAQETEEGLYFVDIDPQKVIQTRERFPFLDEIKMI